MAYEYIARAPAQSAISQPQLGAAALLEQNSTRYRQRATHPVFDTMADASQFDDIRPYHDDEVVAVLGGVIADREFVDLIGKLRAPRMYRRARFMARPLLRWWLK
ncbi:MAG: hypothetical protein HKO07_01620, partial [Pseudomonadales bacterium]|nr:hypothetical protein [Pseudomonadales bacterium]